MKTLSAATLLFLAITCGQSEAQVTLGKSTTVTFATVEEGKEILTRRDDFVQRMSPFDRAARMKTDKDVSEKEYLEFVGKNVLAWNDTEKQKISSAFQNIQASLEDLSLPFPKNVLIIKTTGNEEGGAAYTRANAIVFPKGDLEGPIANIQKTICHELFHILSRANPDLREKLYAAIGFMNCNEVAFPLELKSRKITNPDAPRNDHCIRLQVGGQERWAIPILFSSTEKYDVQRGGEFFDYLRFQFLLVERNDKSSTVKPVYDGQKPKFVDMQRASGFFEQVGKNTGYIIHPEEILADNFALLVLRERNLPSPAIIKKMKGILKGKRITRTTMLGGGSGSRFTKYVVPSGRAPCLLIPAVLAVLYLGGKTQTDLNVQEQEEAGWRMTEIRFSTGFTGSQKLTN
jgi:hypothetical protein